MEQYAFAWKENFLFEMLVFWDASKFFYMMQFFLRTRNFSVSFNIFGHIVNYDKNI